MEAVIWTDVVQASCSSWARWRVLVLWLGLPQEAGQLFEIAARQDNSAWEATT
jgi:hypothetical protein